MRPACTATPVTASGPGTAGEALRRGRHAAESGSQEARVVATATPQRCAILVICSHAVASQAGGHPPAGPLACHNRPTPLCAARAGSCCSQRLAMRAPPTRSACSSVRVMLQSKELFTQSLLPFPLCGFSTEWCSSQRGPIVAAPHTPAACQRWLRDSAWGNHPGLPTPSIPSCLQASCHSLRGFQGRRHPLRLW